MYNSLGFCLCELGHYIAAYCLPSYTASYPRITNSAATLLEKPENSHIQWLPSTSLCANTYKLIWPDWHSNKPHIWYL